MTRDVNREDRALRAISGHRALDLLATLRDRHREPTECLRSPADLDRWLAAAELETEAQATGSDLEAARELRETIDGVVRALLRGEQPPETERRALNERARRPALVPQIGASFDQQWSGGVDAALAIIAREAIELLTSPERELVRECAAAPECSRLYLDRSPGRRRRWCQMEWCGSNAKMRAYRGRRAAATAD